MKPIEIINAEQDKLKDVINAAIKSFKEATGLKINGIEYSLHLIEVSHDSIYYPMMVITYISDGYEVYQNL
jgi:hypothetical protein